MSDQEDAPKSESVGDIGYDPFANAPTVEVAATPAQREMWLSAQSGPEAVCAYNESFSIWLTGLVDDDALLQGLQALADCHEALRGHFSEDGERFLIEPAITVPIAQHDLSKLSADEQVTALARLQEEDARTPYDLARGPLFRAALIRRGAQDRVVLLSANHAACDGWSLDVLLADFGRLYSGFVGKAPLPAPPAHGFSDYVTHCQGPEYAARIETSRTFWRKAFEVLPPPLALPADGNRPPIRSFGARHSVHTIPTDLLERAKQFSRAQGISFFSVLLSAMATLLHRISQQDDLVIGVPVAGHPDVGMEDCVGHLVNLVPVRFRCEPGLPFRDLCRATHATVLDARENATISFGEIVADLAVPRDPSRVPLIAAVLTHIQKYAPGKLVFADCSAEYQLNARRFETFELCLNAIEAREGLQLKAHANSDLYSQTWLDWRLREFECILRTGCTAPDTVLGDLKLLPGEESELLAEWNKTEVGYPGEVALAQLVEAQVARTPEAVAVVCGKTSVTFGELNARANQLARALVAEGAGPDRVVGLYAERSVEMVVALLAVAKSGAAYLPIDPLLPEERVRYILDDSATSLVITERDLREDLSGFAGSMVLLDDPVWRTNSAENLSVDVQPDHLAYVIYTSGSTGKPKGVEVPRGALTNLLWSMRDWLALTAEDRLLAVTTISFDIASADMWLPLLVGAKMVVASREESLDGTSLREQIDRHGITFLQATPITWRLLLEAGWKGKADIQIVCTGEAMPRDLAASLAPMVRRLWNLYGPTETTIWSTGFRVRDGKSPILIGRPVANTQCYVLDQHRQPVPIGVVGELFIGGDGLARGYHARPELTKERFLPDPFNPRKGARMYRTGDLARYLADGNIECLGRTDHQVKIRGYRIELGEIEAALLDDDSIQKAVATVHTDALNESRIVAYVIFAPGRTRTGSEMRRALARQLPEYMLPQIFVELAQLPLSPNGKVDRRALPSPLANEVLVTDQYVEPRTDMEKAIAVLWCELLRIERVSARDNFFALGGHSLMAAQMVAQVHKRTGHRLSLRSVIFETLEQLAASAPGGR